jgi:hypothetical protein
LLHDGLQSFGKTGVAGAPQFLNIPIREGYSYCFAFGFVVGLQESLKLEKKTRFYVFGATFFGNARKGRGE